MHIARCTRDPRSRRDAAGDLKCVYTADEEKNGPDGSIFLLDECGLDADYTIVCEPTGWTRTDGSWGMGIAVANGGNFLVEIETREIKTHIWRPDTGVNAIGKMARSARRVRDDEIHPQASQACRRHAANGFDRPHQGGVRREMQFTPDICHGVLAVVGILPGMTPQSVMADIKRVIDTCMAADPDLKATARPYPGALFVDGTLEQDEFANPTAALGRCYQRILKEAPALYRKNAFNDTIRFAERGRAAITFGPGEDGWPPVNEYIHIDKAVAATKILALTVLELLGTAE